jgi:FkbM family methyltransferase
VKQFVKSGLRGLGLDVRRYNGAYAPDAQLANTLDRLGVDVVFDVGANVGQYAQLLRRLGYARTIVSFEPLSDAHAACVAASAHDAGWQVAPRAAIGGSDGEIQINIAGNSVSSSVRPMLDRHADAAPASRYTGQETVPLQRLDTVASAWLAPGAVAFLKIDTQGFEDAVLDGAPGLLACAAGVQIELSLMPLYEGQPLIDAMIARLHRAGFELWTMWPGFADPATGRLLQVDAIFVRSDCTQR